MFASAALVARALARDPHCCGCAAASGSLSFWLSFWFWLEKRSFLFQGLALEAPALSSL